MAKSKDSNSVSPPEEDKYSEWRVRDALDTVIKYGEICSDEKMLKKVKALAKVKKKEFRSVDDLISHRNEMATKGEDDDESGE